MKIVHACSQNFGGAGIAAYRIFKCQEEAGLDAKMVVVNKISQDKGIYVLYEQPVNGKFTDNTPINYRAPLYNALWGKWQQLMNSYPNRPSGLEIFTDTSSTVKMANSKEILEADIVNFHWMAGFNDYNEIPILFKDKPIVWTLHDQNAFTGGCHYANECLKYTENCGACPQLGSTVENDISRKIWDIKYNAYKDLDITIVTPSKWLGECAKQSKLFGNFPVHVIPYGLPQETFKPIDRIGLRKAANLPLDHKIILFGADNVKNERKGFKYLIEALKKLTKKRKDVALAFFGAYQDNVEVPPEIPMYNFGPVADLTKLSAIYCLSDVFVIPTLEDNLPNTVLESLASGTPVVGHNTGGVPDMVDHKINGYVSEKCNTDDLAAGIEYVIDNPGYQQMRIEARAKAERAYTMSGQAEKYTEVYNSILERRASENKNKPGNTTENKEEQKATVELVYEWPKVSVVTPSFNQAKYLEATIKSIVNQPYPNIEYVIMDGGSTDGSVDIIKKYEDKIHHWESHSDDGQYHAINEGFKHTTGDIMCWLNSDDLYYPNAFQKVTSIFKQNPEMEWITSRPSMINAESRNMTLLNLQEWSRERFLNLDYKYIQQEGTFWKRSLWEKAGSFINTEVNFAGDLELWARFFRHSKLYTIVQLLAAFRKTGDQKSTNFIKEYEKEAESILMNERDLFLKGEDKTLQPAPKYFYCKKENFESIDLGVPFEDLMNEMKMFISAGNYAKAAEVADKLVTIKTDNAELFKIQAAMHLQAGNFSLAKTILWNTVMTFPDEYNAYKELPYLEVKEAKMDNLKFYFGYMEGFKHNIEEFTELKNYTYFYYGIFSDLVAIKLSLDQGLQKKAKTQFAELQKKLIDEKFLGNEIEITNNALKDLSYTVTDYLDKMDFAPAFQYINDNLPLAKPLTFYSFS